MKIGLEFWKKNSQFGNFGKIINLTKVIKFRQNSDIFCDWSYRPLVGWRPQHNLYVDASFREMFIITGSPAPLQGIAVLC